AHEQRLGLLGVGALIARRERGRAKSARAGPRDAQIDRIGTQAQTWFNTNRRFCSSRFNVIIPPFREGDKIAGQLRGVRIAERRHATYRKLTMPWKVVS